jgi:hypothetical protein
MWTRDLHGQKLGQRIGFKNGRALLADSDIEPAPGHERVPHPKCWMDDWFSACDLDDMYDAHDGVTHLGATWPDGPVTTEWDGDGILFRYADGTVPTYPEDGDA